jgi:hypothetical protein
MYEIAILSKESYFLNNLLGLEVGYLNDEIESDNKNIQIRILIQEIECDLKDALIDNLN